MSPFNNSFKQMSSQQPIVIKDDEQIIQENKKFIQEQLKKQNELKAMMGSKFDVVVFLAKQDLQCPQQQKDQIIRKRIIKFFDYNCKIDVARGHFCQRMEPDYRQQSTVPIDTEMIIFGVDFLSTIKIRRLFSMVQAPKIIWIDDSHCKLVFQSPQDAKTAIRSNLKNPEIWDIKVQGQGEMQEQIIPKVWFDLRPYYELNFERRLQIRYATSLEVDITKKRDSFYATYKKAKEQFERDMQLLQSQESKNKVGQLIRRSRPRRNNFQRHQMFERGGNQRSRSRQKKGRRSSRYENNHQEVDRGFYRQQYNRGNRNNQQENRHGMRKKNVPFDHQPSGFNENDLSMVAHDQRGNQQMSPIHGISYALSGINQQFENMNIQADLSFEMEQNRNDYDKKAQKVNLSNIQQVNHSQRSNNGRQISNQEKQEEEDQDLDLDVQVQPKSSSRGYKKFSYRKYIEEKDKQQSQKRKNTKAQVIDLSIDES